MLALEIGGILTGDTLTLPAGAVNTDQTGELTLSRPVAAGGDVRWIVVSGPGVKPHIGMTQEVSAPIPGE